MVVEGSLDKVRLNNEKLLIKKLTENYPQKFGRPLINDTDGPVVIRMRVQLIQIVKLVISDENLKNFKMLIIIDNFFRMQLIKPWSPMFGTIFTGVILI